MVKVVIGIAVAGLAAVALAVGAWALFIREDNELATSPQEIPDELVNPTAEATTAAAADPTTAASSATLAFNVNPELSEAAYFVDEELASVGLPSTAKGATNEITGTLYLTADGADLAPEQGSVFVVDLTGLTSDESRRDQRVQEALNTSTNPNATFTIASATGFDPSIAEGVEQTIQLTGTLELNGVQEEVTWEVKAFRESNVISALATVVVNFADYRITAPTFGGLVSIDDKATLQVQLIAEAA